MAFDPDEYLKEASAPAEGGFDPDAYLSEDVGPEAPPEEATSAPMAALEHYGQAATLGYLPQMQAGVSQVLPSPTAQTDEELRAQGFVLPEDESYVEARDRNIRRLELQAQEHPMAATAGMVGGIVGGGLATGGALRAIGMGKRAMQLTQAADRAAKLGNTARATKLLKAARVARLREAGRAGVVIGGGANPGDIEGVVDPIQMDPRIDAAIIGAITGTAAQGLTEGGGALVRRVGKAMKGKAEERAFKALGPDLRAVRQNMSRDRVQEIGRTLLDEDIVKSSRSRKRIADLIQKTKTAKGKELDKIIQELGEAELGIDAKPGLVKYGAKRGTQAGISRKQIADAIREELISPDTEIPGVAAQNRQVERFIRQFEDQGDELIPVLRGEKLKKSVGKQINWNRLPDADIPIKEQVQRSLYSKLRQGTEDAATVLDEMTYGKGASRFKGAKKAYGNLKEASKIVEKRLERDLANRFISPTDYMTGGFGAAAGFASGNTMEEKIQGALLGASLGAVNRIGRNYGNQFSARALNSISKQVLKIPKVAAFAEKNPAKFQGIVQRTLERVKSDGLQPNKIERLFAPDVLEMFVDDPSLIDSITDPELRDKVRKKIQGKTKSGKDPSRGPAKWAKSGARKLGLSPERQNELMKSERGRKLLIEASDLKPGSKRLERIRKQLERIKK